MCSLSELTILLKWPVVTNLDKWCKPLQKEARERVGQVPWERLVPEGLTRCRTGIVEWNWHTVGMSTGTDQMRYILGSENIEQS